MAEGIGKPDLAVVSGDIVLGVIDKEGDAQLRAQYDEALNFLTQLTVEFFGGDRNRVILVPGNHDISHPHVLRSTELTPLPEQPLQKRLIASQLAEENSVWRWVASDFELRRIVNADAYRQRLEPFARFYEAFYESSRTYSLDPSKQFTKHDLPELGLVVVGLSSCCDNDLFSRSGRIHPDCIAGATRAVTDQVREGRLALAVWHHNLAGGPKESDYVDSDILQSLIDGGFAIGLHGHQHRPQLLAHRFTADRKRSISVISAGTLCGGPTALPSGRMRSYNLIHLDSNQRTGILHVRDMQNSNFSLPVWGRAHVSEFSGSSIEIPIIAPTQPTSDVRTISDADVLLQRGDAAGAYALAKNQPENGLARRVAVEALGRLGDWHEIVRFCSPPRSAPEFIALADALYETKKHLDLTALINSEFARNSTDVGVRASIAVANNRIGSR